MTCRELVDFLGAYLGGELADEIRRRFEEHLAVCPECGAYLTAYRETVKLTKAAFRDPDASRARGGSGGSGEGDSRSSSEGIAPVGSIHAGDDPIVEPAREQRRRTLGALERR